MDARELFCRARDAAVAIRDHGDRVSERRELAVMHARPSGPTGKGWFSDPSRRVDSLIDFDMQFKEGLSGYLDDIMAAYRVLKGLASIDPIGCSVLYMRYFKLMKWGDISDKTGFGYERLREIASVAFDRIDSEGFTAISGGELRGTGAES